MLVIHAGFNSNAYYGDVNDDDDGDDDGAVVMMMVIRYK